MQRGGEETVEGLETEESVLAEDADEGEDYGRDVFGYAEDGLPVGQQTHNLAHFGRQVPIFYGVLLFD